MQSYHPRPSISKKEPQGSRSQLRLRRWKVACCSLPTTFTADRLSLSTPTLLADPTSFEEPLLTSAISVVVDVEGGVVSVERGTIGENDGSEGGLLAFQGTGLLEKCALAAKEHAVVLHKLLE